MTKASEAQLSKNLACEWAADGIRCCNVAPWYIMTPLAAPVLDIKSFRDEVHSRTPMRRCVLVCLPSDDFDSRLNNLT